jgi:tetratricopeptide (TPR) repeat protein
MLQQAINLHQSGRFAEAQSLYRQILTANPNQPDALHLLGVLAHQTGQHAPAEALIRRALAVQPQAAAYHNSLGNVLRALGRAAEAEAAYRAALRLQPNTPDLHHHIGLALKDQGRISDAETAFRHALRLRKDYVPARIDLGNLLVETGRAAEAEVCLRAAVRTAPENAIALNALGLALVSLGRHQEALGEFDSALHAAPNYANAAANRAACLASLENWQEAAGAYQAALALISDAADLNVGFARALLQLERGAEAEQVLRRVLAQQPDDPMVLHKLGRALAFQRRNEEALAVLEQVCHLDPANADAWHDRGMALRDLARWPESVAPFEQAVRLQPDDAEKNASLGYALLANGDFAAGWKFFEWRVKRPGNARLAEPRWDGAQTDKTVLIFAEQGTGDTIQFCRFVPPAARRARIVLACPPALKQLLSTLAGPALLAEGEPLPPYDLQCPVMSLPFVLGVAPEYFSDAIPYLRAEPKKIAAWRARLAHLQGRRVGLVWAGNPKFPADRRRSIDFAVLAPLLETSGISFVSLQVGASPAGAMFDAAPWLQDFSDTAALIAALDLVISVDTAVAHLAGALGRPVWLLNRADTDWRWQLERRDSPWYPTMRQFRQPSPGDWGSVVAAVSVELMGSGAVTRERAAHDGPSGSRAEPWPS